MKMIRNRVWAAAAAVVVAMIGLAGPGTTPAQASPAMPAMQQAADTPDQLIFKDGRIIEGQVLEETATTVRFLVVVAGIKGEQTYNKADILAIERGTHADDAGGAATKEAAEDPAKPAADEPTTGGTGVYVINVEGFYGRDISQTPLRTIAKDAATTKPDYVILVVDNLWESFAGQKFDDTVQAFDQLFLTEDLEPIFTKELPEMLGYQPKMVVWVKNAMGGAAFLPLNFRTIYFSSDAKMGGIGKLEQIFGSTGDARVREKQFSLRLAHARGMANRGGYDGRLIEAMARTDCVLSYRIDNGKAVLVDGPPDTDIGEVLLTDDGEGDNADSDYERARGLGNDNLTLTADIAKILGVSQGTVDTMDDLLYELGIERSARMLPDREEQIRNQWSQSVESAERQIRDLWEKLAKVQVQGERRERMTARAQRMKILRDIIGLLTKYDEVIKVRMFRLPDGLPPIPNLEIMIEALRQEQMKDRP